MRLSGQRIGTPLYLTGRHNAIAAANFAPMSLGYTSPMTFEEIWRRQQQTMAA
jgi:hypothetical protein